MCLSTCIALKLQIHVQSFSSSMRSSLLSKSRECGRSGPIARITHDVRAKRLLVADNHLAARGCDVEVESSTVLRLAVEEANGHIRIGWDIKVEVGVTGNVVGLVVESLGIGVGVRPARVGLCTSPQVNAVVGIRDGDAICTSLAGVDVGVMVQSKEVEIEVSAGVIDGAGGLRTLAVKAANIRGGADEDGGCLLVRVRVEGRVSCIGIARRVVIVSPVKPKIIARWGRRTLCRATWGRNSRSDSDGGSISGGRNGSISCSISDSCGRSCCIGDGAELRLGLGMSASAQSNRQQGLPRGDRLRLRLCHCIAWVTRRSWICASI